MGHLDALRPLFEQIYNPILITDAQLDPPGPRILYANQAFSRLTGYELGELLGKTPRILQGEKSDRAVLDRLKATLKRGEFFQGHTVNYRKDGSPYWVEWNISPILDASGTTTHYYAVQHDITAQKELERLKNHLQEMVEEKTADIVALNEEIEATLRDTLLTLGEFVEGRSKMTGHHVHRVAAYSELLARLAGLADDEVERIKLASTLHDIGKLTVPDAILNKPGPLTEDEFDRMRKHTTHGHAMLRNSDHPLFQTAARIALTHHERWDGGGYPGGLAGEEIPLEGRIVAVADVVDALSSQRSYKPAWDDEQVHRLLRDERGRHLDPDLVNLYLGHLEDFHAIRDAWQDSLFSHQLDPA